MSEKNFIPILPAEGFVDTKQIIGDRKNNIPGVLPVSPSTWYEGIKSGRYEVEEVKDGGRTFYTVQSVRKILEKLISQSLAHKGEG